MSRDPSDFRYLFFETAVSPSTSALHVSCYASLKFKVSDAS